tara:strand:+ start:238888 stop:239889 length:1002 start_codon:yes stop_codon:yes gene_type:complete
MVGFCYNPASTGEQTNDFMTDNKSGLKVQILEVDENSVGQRLDNFLLPRLKGVPKTRIYRIIRKGEVRVNGKRKKPDYKLQLADKVRIPPVRISQAEKPVSSPALDKLVSEAILYQDESLLVINKPSGLSVHAGTGVKISLIDVLRGIFQDEYLELVHRLDKGTSGCLLLARNARVLKKLQAEFRDRSIQKSYHALVSGRWPEQIKEVNAGLQKSPELGGERKVNIDEAGKKSITRFSILKHYKQHSLMLAQPLTGRTHQIRVHAQFAGYSICGDEKYSTKEQAKLLSAIGISRLCLHAAEIELKHPLHGNKLKFTAPYDEKFQSALQIVDSI